MENDFNPLEYKLQEATAAYLSGRHYRGNKFTLHAIPFHHLKFHHPANEGRSEGEGFKFKKRGVTPGITDWLLWGPNKWHGMIELKVTGRGLSSSQKNVRGWATEYGFPHAICHSVAEFRDAIIEWGWQCHNMACIEPDYSTEKDRFRAAVDYFKP